MRNLCRHADAFAQRGVRVSRLADIHSMRTILHGPAHDVADGKVVGHTAYCNRYRSQFFASVGYIDWRPGGSSHQVVRATKDVGFLMEVEAADKVHAALLDLGYQCLYRSADAANYVRGSEGLDLLYAHRPLARRLLAQAAERETPMGRMRIISVEGLIGFKLQGYVNDATRTRDLDDIRALLKMHRASLNMDELREYFALFKKPDLLHELLR
jgi:hypothetical protein